MIAFANIRKSSFSSWTELTIPLGGVLSVVAGRVVNVEEFAGGVDVAMLSVVGVVIAGVPVDALEIAAAPALTAAFMAVLQRVLVSIVVKPVNKKD
jgi:hypothetical protein